MSTRTRRSVALALLLAAVIAWLPSAAASSAGAADGPRVLVYGDSISQGSSGDRTWRCVLWRHLVSSGVQADMVGPRQDLWNWRENQFGSSAYADPTCDTDHAARWGMAFSTAPLDVSDLVDDYRPDVVVALIGVNDLVWLGASPADLVQRWRSEIGQARAIAPHTSFVLVPVPEHWFTNVVAYDDALPSLHSELDTPDSRVMVSADPDFQIDRDTFDDAHPSANGEVRIAAVAADSLAGISIGGPWPRPLVEVAPGPAFAPVPRVTAREGHLTATWPGVEYANAMRVWSQDVTSRGPWLRRTGPIDALTWSAAAPAGHTVAIRLQPVKGRLPGGTLSSAVRVRIPARPAAVHGLRAARVSRCRARLTWSAARFATGYRVALRDVTARAAWRVIQPADSATRRVLTSRLRHRHRYAVSVRSYGPLAGGISGSTFRSCR